MAAAADLDERVRALIRHYARPGHGGWVMAAKDILCRLRAWHGVDITAVELAFELARRRGVPRG
jgi:hypothetical protein